MVTVAEFFLMRETNQQICTRARYIQPGDALGSFGMGNLRH